MNFDDYVNFEQLVKDFNLTTGDISPVVKLKSFTNCSKFT